MMQIIKIVTVDTKTRRVEGVLTDGAVIRVTVTRVGPAFRWPVEGEFWSVNRAKNNQWYLGERHEVESEHGIEQLEPGDTKLSSDRIFTESGDEVVAIQGDREVRPGNTVPTWDSGDKKWKPTDASSVSVPDKNFVWPQGAASQFWGEPIGDPTAVISHNLGKRPAVTVVDSAGSEIEVDVQHIDNNKVKIHLSGAASGSAYFN